MVPILHHGLQTTLAQRMEELGVLVRNETIRKYLNGTILPRPDRMAALARVLGVDLAWLSKGIGGDRPVWVKRQEPMSPVLRRRAVSRPGARGLCDLPTASI